MWLSKWKWRALDRVIHLQDEEVNICMKKLAWKTSMILRSACGFHNQAWKTLNLLSHCWPLHGNFKCWPQYADQNWPTCCCSVAGSRWKPSSLHCRFFRGQLPVLNLTVSGCIMQKYGMPDMLNIKYMKLICLWVTSKYFLCNIRQDLVREQRAFDNLTVEHFRISKIISLSQWKSNKDYFSWLKTKFPQLHSFTVPLAGYFLSRIPLACLSSALPCLSCLFDLHFN